MRCVPVIIGAYLQVKYGTLRKDKGKERSNGKENSAL